jgi:mono/diheme cytochrome c family protein
MRNHGLLLLAVIILFAVACGAQPLPDAPTPIPTLIPATLPPEQPTQAVQGGQTPQAGGTATTGGGTAEQVAAGKQIFDTNCTPCHNLTTETKVGPGLAGLYQFTALPNGKPVTDANVSEWIHTGGGGMPAFTFDEAQTAALIAYLKEATK